jgi:hypothetical protein
MNRLVDAEAAAAEAVAQYRKLSLTEPDMFTIGVAGSLNYQAGLLTGLGRLDQAQACLVEATALRQRRLCPPGVAPGTTPPPA